MRLHVVALPHADTTLEYERCGFTSNVRKFASLMTGQGADVVLYGGPTNDADVAEHVQLVSKRDRRKWFGKKFDARTDRLLDWNGTSVHWATMNERAVKEIGQRAEPGEYLCVIGGDCQQAIAAGVPHLTPVEFAVGYRGVFAPHRVFASYAWMHHIADRHPNGVATMRHFDAVIPHPFETELYPAQETPGDHFVYFGRLVGSKGPQVAADVCRAIGAKLLLAGEGAAKIEPGCITAEDGTLIRGDVEHLGVLPGHEARAELLGGARAVFTPSSYLEPFGSIAIEAMLCGTPVLATDFGGYTETVVEGVTGFRANTLAEFVRGAEMIPLLDRRLVRKHAAETYSIEAIAPRYRRFFDRLETLKSAGWYSLPS